MRYLAIAIAKPYKFEIVPLFTLTGLLLTSALRSLYGRYKRLGNTALRADRRPLGGRLGRSAPVATRPPQRRKPPQAVHSHQCLRSRPEPEGFALRATSYLLLK